MHTVRAESFPRRLNKENRCEKEPLDSLSLSFFEIPRDFSRGFAMFRNRRTRHKKEKKRRGREKTVKKEEKTNGRTEQAARIYGTKGKDLNGLSQKAFSYSPWQTTMAKWREREHILNRFPSSVRDIFTCKPATDASSQPLCQRVQHVARYRRCVCVRRHRTVATCLLASTQDSCPFLFFSFLSFPFFGGSEFKRFKAISLGVNRAPDPPSLLER